MSTIFVRKLCVVVGVFFCGILLALPVCSQASENNCTKITEQLNDNNKKHFDSQSDLRQQLLERSKKYLLSIENNQSFSPELKKRLVLQSRKVIESGLRKLSNTSVVRGDLLQAANGQINTAFAVNALNKIGNNDTQKQQNTLRTFEFLRGHFLCAKKVYIPTIYEVVLRVALPDEVEVVNRVRIFFRRDVNIESPLCRFIFGAIGCGEIISTTSRSRDSKSFAKLLAKDVISITAPQLTNTNFSHTTIFTDKITATSILVAETVILRN